MFSLRRPLSAALAAVLAVSGVTAVGLASAAPAFANPDGTGLVINEVYVNGGSTGATYKYKFIELYNPTASSITITGSVQYRAPTSTGSASGITALSNVTIGAHSHYLIQGASNNAMSNPGADLPTPDLAGTLNPGAGGGTIFLTTATSTVNPTTDTGLIDRVGWGTSNDPEGTVVPAASVNLTHGITRANGVDSDNNNSDFTSAAPTPQNAASDAPALSLAAISDQTIALGASVSPITLSVSDGTAPYTYSLTGAPSTDGLSVDTSGVISGTPSGAGTFTITAHVTDSTTATASTSFTLTVNAPTLTLATVPDKNAFRNTPIAPFTLSATSGTAPYSYSFVGDSHGLTVNPSTGVVSGFPDAPGSFTITAQATDSAGTPSTDQKSFTLTVADGDTATHVLIAGAWGDGGFSNGGGSSAWKNDYVELYNPTSSAVDLSSYSIGYGAYNRTATTPLATAPLVGSIPAHSYYLVAFGSDGSAGADLPTPDALATAINMDYRDGVLALFDTTDSATLAATLPPVGDIVAPSWTNKQHVIDALGFGATNTFEGTATGTNLTQTTAISRTPVGTDTDNNHSDFAIGGLTPINSLGQTFPQLKVGAVTDQSVLVNQPVDLPTLTATGGVGTHTFALSGAPDGIGVDSATGVITGSTSQTGSYVVTATATDSLGHTATAVFTLNVGTFLVQNPGDQTFDTVTPVNLVISATNGSSGYQFAVKAGSTMPNGLTLNETTGAITGTPLAAQPATPLTITVTNNDDDSTIDVTFSITITSDVLSIASVQGDGARSPYAPASGTTAGTTTVTTEGVVTAVWGKGFSGTGTSATPGTANSGLSGFVIQSPGDPSLTAGSDAIFVYVGSSFAGKDKNGTTLTVGQSVKVSGTVSEYKAASAVSAESETELNATTANVAILPFSLGTVDVQTTLPATYADREAHEFEAFAPTDAVITDTYQYETDGELGVASGGTPLVQPTEICSDDGTPADTTCLAAAQQDIIDRGYFLGDGTNTFFTSSSTHYAPNKSGNSDIPLPYMDATHSVRVGAAIQLPAGHALILAFSPDLSSTSASRPGKWYLQPERPILSSHGGTADLGSDVIGFEDTRATNLAPNLSDINAHGTSNLKIATFNVENYFTETGAAFAAANPAIGTSPAGTTSATTVGCQYDTDRAGNPILTYQCVSPWGRATAWDPVSGAPTAYTPYITNGPRGAATQADLDRQTAKIVKAINGLGADIVSLEEIENPNRLKEGTTNSPLSPDLGNLKDQGQGTPIANRDAALAYLVDKLNAAAGADVWGYVKSPEEATDATSMVHLCAITNADGSPIAGNDASRANASCSYASMQDVIRTAFIYKKATVVPVGPSDMDFPSNPLSPDNPGNNAPTPSPFDIAREPLAQFFKPVGYPDSDGFAVIVNHFKSKGNDTDTPGVGETGENYNDPLVGSNNGNRVAEARELVRFANQFAAQWNTDKVLMVGDFNSYTKEDPIQEVLADSNVDGGLHFSLLTSTDPNDLTYNYTTNVTVNGDTVGYGTVGSIDHEFASAGFLSMVTGADVWEINANETDAYDYGRYNTNGTNFYYGASVPSSPSYMDDLAVATPFRSSDHNPMIMGIDLPALDANSPKVTDVQIVGVNDFHGRLVADSSDGGAAALGGAVDELRDQYGADSTIFASAGDNVGASTFESFTQQDKPSLDALTAMGLQVSAVGNHEFDKGWQDILNRLDKPYDADTNPYGATGGTSWGDYLAANVVYSTDPDGDGPLHAGDPITAATKEFTIQNPLNPGTPIKVGFIGTVTPDLVSLESPANLAGVHVDSEVETIAAINGYASQLKANGDQLVILLTHEGAASTDCSAMLGSGSSFAQELNGISDDVDAVLSGHTHLEYSCSFPVAGWSGRSITSRPVMQAGSYAVALDQLVYSFDASSHPVSVVSNLVGVKGPVSTLFSAPDDTAVKSIVDAAVAASAAPGAQVLGELGGPFDRARLSDGTENRGGESTLGNQIAEIQRWATDADIAFMNPGGLRADLDGTNGNLTYRQAADVQPFANELTKMTLTGAQIQQVLSEQWSRDNIDNAHANIPARPFLKLGISDGFTYTYHEVADPVHAGATLGVIDGMWLNGTPIDLAQSYTVTVNSFLATGGDNFWELANGTNQQDTEQTDLQAQVDYMQQYNPAVTPGAEPLPVDYSQRGVRVTFPSDAPATYSAGDHVVFDLSSLDMTGPHDTKDGTLTVKLGDTVLDDSVAVSHNNSTQPYDDRGTAHVDVVLPSGAAGTQTLTIVGNTTGTRVLVPFTSPNGTITPGTPGISGPAVVGQTLTASTGSWTPSDVTFSYVWKAGSSVIAGEDGPTLLLTGSQLGSAITVTVTGSKPGYDDASATSDATAAVTANVVLTLTATTGSAAYGADGGVSGAIAAPDGGPAPDGTVTVSDGATVIGSAEIHAAGPWQVQLPAFSEPVGSHSLTVTYAADSHYADDTSHSYTYTVTTATATLTAHDISVNYGKSGSTSLSLTGVDGGSAPTGAITASLGTIKGSTLTIPAFAKPAGSYTVQLNYPGDAHYAAGTATIHYTVSAVPVSMTVNNGGSITTAYNVAKTIPVRVVLSGAPDASGTLQVRLGSRVVATGTVAANGTGTVTLASQALPVGSRQQLTVSYHGTATGVGGMSRTVRATVTKAGSRITLSPKSATVTYGAPTSIIVTVAPSSGTAFAPTGTVVVTRGSTTLASGTLHNGTVTLTLGAKVLKAGSYSLTVHYGGSSVSSSASVTLHYTVKR